MAIGRAVRRRCCRSNALEPNMSRKRNYWANAVAKPFLSSVQKNRLRQQINKNREVPPTELADYLDAVYNRMRRRSHLSGATPEKREAAHKVRRTRVH